MGVSYSVLNRKTIEIRFLEGNNLKQPCKLKATLSIYKVKPTYEDKKHTNSDSTKFLNIPFRNSRIKRWLVNE
jgi:hypothetical protein